jgi:tetratricopeptide (TPR) repeat protein
MKRMLALVAVCAAVAAGACLYQISVGIHIKGEPAVDFGDPPHREGTYGGDGFSNGFTTWRPGTTYLVDGSAEERYDASATNRERRDVAAEHAAEKLEELGRYREALAAFRLMLHKGQGNPDYLRQQIEILKQGFWRNDLKSVRDFLAGRGVESSWLLPYAKYDRLMKAVASAERAKGFEELANEFPDSPRAEPALMMAGRELLRADIPEAKVDPTAGQRLLKNLLAKYPRSRFRGSALGWLARSDFLQGHYAEALAKYWLQLPLVPAQERIKLYESMSMCESALSRAGRHAYTVCLTLDVARRPSARAHQLYKLQELLDGFKASDAKVFWSCLRESPRALSSYLDFRLDRTTVTRDLPALLGRAHFERSPYAGHILGRIAEACFRLHRYDMSRRFAERCLASSPGFDDRALATYLSASVDQKKGRFDRAITIYETLTRTFPKAYVAGGARENLALLYERCGRTGKALDCYYALGYRFDIAYMLDARMSSAEIASYIRSHRRHPEIDAIRYSLGIRYLREHRFDEARQTLAAVPEWKRKAYLIGDLDYEDGAKLWDPLHTATELQSLYLAVDRAHGQEAKSKALVAIGDYYYDHRNLLLYNLRLWQGQRAYAIGFSWNTAVATASDDQALRRHHEENECLSQALIVFDQVVRRYPRTYAAQHAAYRGACAAWRLTNFNPYWRWLGERRNLQARAANLMSFASKGKDKALAKRAAKFAGVYMSDVTSSPAEFKEDLPKRRWNPNN